MTKLEPEYTPVVYEKHKDLGWHSEPQDLRFAAGIGVVPISGTELPLTALCHPIGILPDKDTWQFVALMGFDPFFNVHVGPEGEWSGHYIPNQFRKYPFSIGENSELIMQQDPKLIVEDAPNRFFDSQGEPTAEHKNMINFILEHDHHRKMTAGVLNLIAEHGAIQPWSLQKLDVNFAHPILTKGLYTFDEMRLRILPDNIVGILHRAGAFSLITLQLLSTHHVGWLAEKHKRYIAERRIDVEKKAATIATDSDEISLDLGDLELK